MEQRLIDANAYRKEWMEMRTFEPMKVLDMQETVFTIPENPTNRDMIKAMFPNMKVGFITENQVGVYYVKNAPYATVFDLEWWNAPWKGGKE